jgi:type VI protein secretion system component VasF
MPTVPVLATRKFPKPHYRSLLTMHLCISIGGKLRDLKSQNVSIEEARSQVAQYEQRYRQVVDRAKQQVAAAAETTATATSRGALFGAIALVLGAVAAWFGGRLGAVEPTITSARLMPARREPLH